MRESINQIFYLICLNMKKIDTKQFEKRNELQRKLHEKALMYYEAEEPSFYITAREIRYVHL